MLFLNFFTAYATQATALLFGNILGVDAATVWTLLLLGIVAIAALAAIARPLLFASLQPELAEAKGVSLRLVSVLFLAIVALGVAECAQIVGVLLVFALMVGPAAAAQRLTTRFWCGIALSVALALSRSVAGPCAGILHRLADQLLDHYAEWRCLSGGGAGRQLANRGPRSYWWNSGGLDDRRIALASRSHDRHRSVLAGGLVPDCPGRHDAAWTACDRRRPTRQCADLSRRGEWGFRTAGTDKARAQWP